MSGFFIAFRKVSMFSPAIFGAIMLAVAVVSFGAGFAVENWRQGAQIEKVRGQNTLLSNVNDKCAEDVANARTAMLILEAATNELERQAAKAVKEAEPKVAERKRVIATIKASPHVAPDMQCEAIIKEQVEYVQTRK